VARDTEEGTSWRAGTVAAAPHRLNASLDHADLAGSMACQTLSALEDLPVVFITVYTVVVITPRRHVLNGDPHALRIALALDDGSDFALSDARGGGGQGGVKVESCEGFHKVRSKSVGVWRIFKDGFPAFRRGAGWRDKEVFGERWGLEVE
jgi:hypothetical protein